MNVCTRPAVLAALTAALLSSPAAALARTSHAGPGSPAPGAGVARAWAAAASQRGVPLPAGAAGQAGAAAAAAAPMISSELLSVAAVSPSRAFAVGTRCVSGCGTSAAVNDTLIMHWNGKTWSQLPSPDPGPSYNVLTGVTAVSATRAWAVGLYCPAAACSDATTRSLILKWDGKTWTRVPGPGGNSELLSVSADSATDGWAVGATCPPGCTAEDSLTVHWNGKSWAAVPAAGVVHRPNVLESVSSSSPRVAWAADFTEATPALLRWNGKKWATVAFPAAAGNAAAAAGLAVLSAKSAWAVGSCTSCKGTTGLSEMLAMKWNGKAWSVATTPVLTEDNQFHAVSARSATDVWAVGTVCQTACGEGTEADTLLIMHWAGKTWAQLPAPAAGGGGQDLFGVSADSARDAWAVGFTCTAGCGTASPVLGSLILHWDGHAWSVS